MFTYHFLNFHMKYMYMYVFHKAIVQYRQSTRSSLNTVLTKVENKIFVLNRCVLEVQ